MKKKSQMEIMGLAIIIVLLFLGMVFVIKFIVLKEPKEYKKEYVHTELASNIIGAMLYTTAEECSMVTFAKLFQDCAIGEPGSIHCGISATLPSAEWYSCAYAEYYAQQILKDTLGELNIKYYFKVEAGNRLIFDLESPCPGERKQKRYPLPGANTIYVVLDICG